MAYEMREGQGSIFQNNRKEKDTHPDLTGSALIEGVEYWVSGWKKKDKNGNTWVSLALKKKEEKSNDGSTKRNTGKLEEDDLPF